MLTRLVQTDTHLGTGGSTLVESMVAMVIVAASAAALYPIFNTVKEQSKFGDARELCQNVVRSKLDEYRFGRPINLDTEITAQTAKDADWQRLKYLSWGPLSSSAVTLNSGGAVTLKMANGFYYSKLRYNLFPGACVGVSSARILSGLSPEQRQFGMRECIGSNTAITEPLEGPPPNISCTSAIDQKVATELPGFKLYVRLQLDTPWPLGINPARSAQFDDVCPYFTPSGSAVSLYDFDGYNDGIKVTVTGVIDLPAQPDGKTAKLGGVPETDSSRLMCTASSTIRPDSHPVRYYLSRSDKRIYKIQGKGRNGSENNDNSNWEFTNVYTQEGGERISDISAFAVHPRNLSLYVLKSNLILRYGLCNGIPLNCSVDSSQTGVSDDGANSRPVIQEFHLPQAAISQIAVDFRNNKFYGVQLSGGQISEVYELLAGGVPLQSATGQSYSEGQMTLTAVPANTWPLKPAGGITSAPRITGFFMDPYGNDAYISDTSSGGSLDGGSFAASVFRLSDVNLTSPIFSIRADVASFSK